MNSSKAPDDSPESQPNPESRPNNNPLVTRSDDGYVADAASVRDAVGAPSREAPERESGRTSLGSGSARQTYTGDVGSVRHVRVLLVWSAALMVGAVLLVAAYSAYSQWLESRGRAQLALAREQLEDSIFDPQGPEWIEKLNRAETLLRQVGGTTPRRSAQLLLNGLRVNRGIQVREEEVLSPSSTDCPTVDLSLASLLFFRGAELALADHLASLAVQRGDERPRALRAATIVAYQLGRDRDVVQHATEWAQVAPDDAMPWQYLAFVAEDRGLRDDTIAALRNQIRLTHGSTTELRRSLTRHLIQSGDAVAARREFTALQNDPSGDKTELALHEARLLFLEGQLDSAQRILQTGKFPPGDQVDAALLQSRILMEHSEPEKAIPLLRDCVQKDPANQDSHYLLGQALSRAGAVAEARKHLETHRQLLDLKVKINGLERQAGHQGHNVEVRLELAKLYRQIGLKQQADFWEESANAARQGRVP